MSSSVAATATYPEFVGCVLTMLRKDLKINQSAVAEAVGLGVSTWSRIENGESALTIEQLALAAQAFGVTPGLILQLADSMIPVLKEQRGVGIAPNRDRGGTHNGAISLSGASLHKVVKAIPDNPIAIEKGSELAGSIAELVKDWLHSQSLASAMEASGNPRDAVQIKRSKIVEKIGTATTDAKLAGTAGAASVASGMATVGSVGRGMATGAITSAAAPIATVAALGYGLFKLFED